MAKNVRIAQNHPVKKRLIAFLTASGNYNASDNEIVDLYVETFDFYQRMREVLLKNDLLVSHTNKIGATNLMKNPLAIEITKTVQVLSNLLKSMGLTPAQRKSLEKGGDELEEFINA